MDIVDYPIRATSSKLCYSQPVEMEVTEPDDSKSNKGYSFSQPTHIEDLLVSTQLMQSQSTSPNMDCLDKLVKRMTRFFVKVSTREVLDRLRTAVDKLGYKWNSFCEGVVTISSKVSRYGDVIFKVNILNMPVSILLDFRLSSGCGLEFKKCFIAIKRELCDVIDKELPISGRNFIK